MFKHIQQDLVHIQQEQKEMQGVLNPQASPTPTPAVRGSDALERMRRLRFVRRFDVVEGAEAVMSEEQATELKTTTEGEVVAGVRPYLAKVFAPRLVTNGEDVLLPPFQTKGGLKPDNVIALPFFLLKKDATKCQQAVQRARDNDTGLIFGAPCSETIFADASIPAEAKLKIGEPTGDSGNVGLGDAENYLKKQIETWNKRNASLQKAKRPPLTLPVSVKAILYGRRHFWLLAMETAGCQFCQLVWGEWTDAGSVDAIRNFFPLLPWELAVQSVFEKLSWSPTNPFGEEEKHTSAFLGEGGMGRVFRAQHDAKIGATKVVLQAHAALLEKEFKSLEALAKVAEDDLPLVKPCSDFISTEHGAGYVQTPCGLSSLYGRNLGDRVNQKSLLLHACSAISKLHFARVTHGDPRLANFIVTGNRSAQVILCDPAALNSNPGHLAFEADLKIFCNSCGSIPGEDLVEAYAAAMVNRTFVFETHMQPILKQLLQHSEHSASNPSSSSSSSSSSSKRAASPSRVSPSRVSKKQKY
jgi:hypothetical protein